MILKTFYNAKIMRLALVLGVLFYFSGNSFSQASYCFSPDSTPNASLNTAIASASPGDFGAGAPVTLRLYFHVIRRTNGTGGYLPNDVQTAYDILQTDFNPHGIFFAWDGCIDYIDDDARYNNWVNNSIYNVNNHTDGMDAYLFPEDHITVGGRANGVGVSSEFWVSGSWPGTGPVALSKIISHEMGHCIFCWHTHHGCESGDWDLIDNSNCAFAGDFVCDTPADPHIGFNVDANCNWTGVAACSPPEPVANYTPDETLIMAYTDPQCMASFTPGQGQRMYFAVQLMPYLQDCVVTTTIPTEPCDCPAENITINEDTVIDTDMVVTGDLNVIDGAELTITATVYFTTGHGLNVFETSKLIVDGGKLTSCDATWRGVKAAGGNSDFDVTLTNSAVLENTSEAAVSFDPPYGPPTNLLHGNGILLADNTTFTNTDSAVEFFSWSALPNPSVVKTSVQNGGQRGITNENCFGIEILSNEFNVNQNCIESNGGAYKIIGNDFYSNSHDILYTNTSAGISSLVEKNTFNGNTFGYRAIGTTFAQNEIVSNKFVTNFCDIYNDGQNSFKVWKNSITATYGAVSGNNGNGIGDVHNNIFDSNSLGIYTFGTNDDFNFYLNCFNTNWVDVYVSGTVSPVIHYGGSAANNCFTHGGIPDIGGAPSPFTYIEPNDKALNCKDVFIAPAAVNVIQFGPLVALKCDDAEIGPPIKDPCDPIKELGAATEAYLDLKAQSNDIKDDGKLSSVDKQALLDVLDDCIGKVKGLLAELNIEKGQYDEVRKLYDGEGGEGNQVYVYSSYILENDLKSAGAYLGKMSTKSEALQDFVEIQKINLERLEAGSNYKTKGDELYKLEELGVKSHAYASYAKSLYYVLTGKTIDTEFPKAEGNVKAIPRNSKVIIQDVKVYPNPFVDNLTIELTGYDNAEIEVTDFYGKRVYRSKATTGVHKVNNDGWANGMYFVIVRNEGKVVFQEKALLME